VQWADDDRKTQMQAILIEERDGDGGPILGTPYWVSLDDLTQNDERMHSGMP
jgi:hypothetical protein